MSNWQLTMVVGFPMITVLIGILVNQVQLSGLHGQLAGIREDLRMLTGKVMELSDRVSHLEASQGGMR